MSNLYVMKTDDFPADPLFELERKIARRADELSRKSGNDSDRALDCWLQAEREIWSSFAPSAEPVPVQRHR